MGVNKYRLDKQEEVEVLEIDNSRVREKQIARIDSVRKARDNAKVATLPDRCFVMRLAAWLSG